MELLKDVQNKQDLLIRLVVHDIEGESESHMEEEPTTDDYEFVLREDVREASCELFENEATEAGTESPEATWKPPGEPTGKEVKWPAAKLDQPTHSSILAVTNSFWGNEPQCEVSEEQGCR